MSKEAVDGFYAEVLRSPGLQEQFKSAASETAFIDLAVDLGSRHGFAFTADEVRARLDEARGGTQRELSDRELEAVAGGYTSLGSSILCGYCGSQSGTSGDSRITKAIS